VSRFLPPDPPADPAALSTLLAEGNALSESYKIAAAEILLRRALAMDPDNPKALLALAAWHYRRAVDYAAAMDYAFRALNAEPGNAMAHKIFGLSARAHGLSPLAVGHLRRALELDPNDSNTCFHLGLTLIQFGVWDQGWEMYERRPATHAVNAYNKPTPAGSTQWRGEDLTGRSIALLGEDGHGDQLQNVRFARNILALNPARLILDVRPPLRRLFLESLNPYAGATAISADPAPTDYVIAFGSMAPRFSANPSNLAAHIPYLSAPATMPASNQTRIGIVWRGSPWLDTDRIRSIPLDIFSTLFDASPTISWVSLQEAALTPEERASLAAHHVETPLAENADFYDTARVIAGLDLVISVDTSIIHLAGGMGKPTWLLNRATSEWRWGWRSRHSPWYPTLRIFNQETLLDWPPVLETVKQTLRNIL
jgi:hypothetical protein